MHKQAHYSIDHPVTIALTGMVTALRTGRDLLASLAERAEAAGVRPYADYFDDAARLAGLPYCHALDLYVDRETKRRADRWDTGRRTWRSADRANAAGLVGCAEGRRVAPAVFRGGCPTGNPLLFHGLTPPGLANGESDAPMLASPRHDVRVDFLDAEARSRRMSLIRGRDTKPEMVVRSYLHRRGLRYRLHDRSLPGKPDLVFPARGVVLFVHGCFWHGHGCRMGKLPQSRTDYWWPKIARNQERDRRNTAKIRRLGWRVLTIRECQINEARLEQIYRAIVKS